MKKLSERGFVHLAAILLILLGILVGVFLVTHPTFFSPKAASDQTRLEFVDNNGGLITNTSSQDVKVRLVYVPQVTPPPSITPSSTPVACLPGCCGGSGSNVCGTCPNGQICRISNGACRSGLSCDPTTGTPSPSVTPKPTPTPTPSPSKPPTPPLSCSQCILNNRSDILPFYKQNGWDTSSSNYDNIVNNWCSKVGADATSQCKALKSGTCSSSCKTSLNIGGFSSVASALVPTAYAATAGGKQCVYAEAGTCHLGNCLDGSQNCSLNSNCGYVPGYSSGQTVDCSFQPSSAPIAGGATCTYSENGVCHEGNCLDGSQNCGFNQNCGYVSGFSSGKTVVCPSSSDSGFALKMIDFGLTSWGINVDPRSTDKIPNPDQFTYLNPGWVRYEYFPEVGLAKGLPKSVKQLLIFDYSSVSGDFPRKRTGLDKDWVAYINGPFTDALTKLLNNVNVDAIEVWNEEDDPCGAGPNGYCPSVPVDAYAAMLAKASQMIKTKYPNIQVVVGGLDSGNTSYVSQLKNAGVLDKVDAIGIHPYGKSLSGWNANGSLPFGDLGPQVKDYQNASGKSIWVTETSLNTTNLPLQKEYLQRLGAEASSDNLPVIVWYAFTDSMNPTFGLVDTNGKNKPVADAFHDLTNLPTNTYPTSFRLANSQGELAGAQEQTFDQNNKVVSWKLTSGNGLKTVYAQFKVNGSWGSPVSNSIVLKIPPVKSPSPKDKYDLNGDGVVNAFDYAICLGLVSTGNNPKVADFDNDGVVDLEDCKMILTAK